MNISKERLKQIIIEETQKLLSERFTSEKSAVEWRKVKKIREFLDSEEPLMHFKGEGYLQKIMEIIEAEEKLPYEFPYPDKPVKAVNEMMEMMDPVTLSIGGASLYALWRLLSSKSEEDPALANVRRSIEKKMEQAGMVPPGGGDQDAKQPESSAADALAKLKGMAPEERKAALHRGIQGITGE